MNNINYIYIDEVSSTNDYLKELTTKNNIPEWSTVVAKYQNSGRGQGDNVWESEYGKNLLFSTLFNPSFLNAEQMFMISKVISLGIVTYLNTLDKQFTIKWPNDIYYNDKKLAGILIENSLLGSKLNYSMVGIGININQEKFMSDAPNPISLKNIFNKDFDTRNCLKDILSHIDYWYELLKKGNVEPINKSYFSNLYRNTNFYNYKSDNQQFSAKIIDVESDGKLVLKMDDNTLKTFYFKGVEFVL